MAIKNEVIFITGASSGIGLGLAKMLAQDNRVIASARNEQALQDLAAYSPNIETLVFDVSDKQQLPSTKEKLEALCPHIDRLILNAGNCHYLEPEKLDWSIFDDMMSVNFFGWINAIQVSLDLLKRATRPHITGIASQVIHAPFSRAEAYGASKAAASYLLKSLALDLKHLNIDVSLVHPGFVDTPLTQKNDFPMPFLMNVDEACLKIVNAIDKRKAETSFPKRLRLMLALSSVAPNFWMRRMAYKS